MSLLLDAGALIAFEILTSDPGDLAALAYAAGKTLIITPV